MSTVLHAHGFVDDGRPTGVKIATYEGTVEDVARGVIAVIQSHGHTTSQVRTTRTLGDPVVTDVEAFINVNGTEQWHVFTTPGERWSMIPAVPVVSPREGTQTDE